MNNKYEPVEQYNIDPGSGRPAAEKTGCLQVVIGFVLILIGIPMLVCPGPGVATIVAGFGMIVAGLGLRRRR